MTHNERVLLVGVLLTGFGLAVGWALCWWSRRAAVDAAYDAGDRDGYREGYDFGRADERAEQDARLATAEGEGRALHGLNHAQSDVARPSQDAERGGARSITEPGRTIYPELAALAAPDVPRPDPPSAAGAGHTYTMSDHWHFMADWRTEAVTEAHAFDDWLPGYLEEFRRGLTPGWVAAYQLLEA